jgi:hypothetical protein
MAKPNYSFQKRQRELAKKAKKEEKLKKKMGSEPPAADDAQAPLDPAAPKEPGAAG